MVEANAFFGHYPIWFRRAEKAAVVRGPLMFGSR
jgi:hypothetical protein